MSRIGGVECCVIIGGMDIHSLHMSLLKLGLTQEQICSDKSGYEFDCHDCCGS